jgi:hypothetical protein
MSPLNVRCSVRVVGVGLGVGLVVAVGVLGLLWEPPLEFELVDEPLPCVAARIPLQAQQAMRKIARAAATIFCSRVKRCIAMFPFVLMLTYRL